MFSVSVILVPQTTPVCCDRQCPKYPNRTFSGTSVLVAAMRSWIVSVRLDANFEFDGPKAGDFVYRNSRRYMLGSNGESEEHPDRARAEPIIIHSGHQCMPIH